MPNKVSFSNDQNPSIIENEFKILNDYCVNYSLLFFLKKESFTKENINLVLEMDNETNFLINYTKDLLLRSLVSEQKVKKENIESNVLLIKEKIKSLFLLARNNDWLKDSVVNKLLKFIKKYRFDFIIKEVINNINYLMIMSEIKSFDYFYDYFYYFFNSTKKFKKNQMSKTKELWILERVSFIKSNLDLKSFLLKHQHKINLKKNRGEEQNTKNKFECFLNTLLSKVSGISYFIIINQICKAFQNYNTIILLSTNYIKIFNFLCLILNLDKSTIKNMPLKTYLWISKIFILFVNINNFIDNSNLFKHLSSQKIFYNFLSNFIIFSINFFSKENQNVVKNKNIFELKKINTYSNMINEIGNLKDMLINIQKIHYKNFHLKQKNKFNFKNIFKGLSNKFSSKKKIDKSRLNLDDNVFSLFIEIVIIFLKNNLQQIRSVNNIEIIKKKIDNSYLKMSVNDFNQCLELLYTQNIKTCFLFYNIFINKNESLKVFPLNLLNKILKMKTM